MCVCVIRVGLAVYVCVCCVCLLESDGEREPPPALCVRFPELYGLVVLQRCRGDDVLCGMAGGA